MRINKILTVSAILTMAATVVPAKTKKVELRIIETSDVHGSFFPFDDISQKPTGGTLSRVSSYVTALRSQYGPNLILLDNGDILQGQPISYYCNYINPAMPNIASQVINYMRYDAETVGNHDVETGHAVYDKWRGELECPLLGANVVDATTGEPYFAPYTIIQRDGVKVAILGMLTPAIPNWLNETLWKGLRFEEMVSSARKWMDRIRRDESPDVIIGLFHSGKEGGIVTDQYAEDASIAVAQQVPGFDAVLYGHDHTRHQDVITNVDGKPVVCLDPSSKAYMVADVRVTVEKRKGKLVSKQVTGELVRMDDQPVDEAFMSHFCAARDSVQSYISRRIGRFEDTVYTRDCYFGSAPFTDLVQNLQLQMTGADISFNAPLTFDSKISAGDVHMSDMFNLYRYENQLYVLMMTGDEVRKHLEMSYDLWVNTMTSPDDHIMLLADHDTGDQQRYYFKNLAFNFDSAAGIDYEVDVTKPDGQKVTILRMSDGTPFDSGKWYKVAMNSYRGSGGGELLTRGAGIAHDQIESRIVYRSDRDLRYYLAQEIEKAGTISPRANNNWRFVPEEWTKPAIERDRSILFAKPLP